MIAATNTGKPWVSFCMSTYRRPGFLARQLESLSQQAFRDFEVVISDNDPEASAEAIVKEMSDPRFRYYCNNVNLGMVASFNKSIDRALADHIVMITDDDPVDPRFLQEMYQLYLSDNSCSVYAGFNRTEHPLNETERILPVNFIKEILDVNKTPSLLWSSCVMNKADVVAVGKMPEYGSPHFADQAMISMTGSRHGGLVINKMFSTLSTHDSNFSKSNFHLYTIGCQGFYALMNDYCKDRELYREEKNAVMIHLGKWFFGCIFTLRKYFTLKQDKKMDSEVVRCAHEILALPFMKSFRPKYHAKTIIFHVKKRLGLLK